MKKRMASVSKGKVNWPEAALGHLWCTVLRVCMGCGWRGEVRWKIGKGRQKIQWLWLLHLTNKQKGSQSSGLTLETHSEKGRLRSVREFLSLSVPGCLHSVASMDVFVLIPSPLSLLPLKHWFPASRGDRMRGFASFLCLGSHSR